MAMDGWYYLLSKEEGARTYQRVPARPRVDSAGSVCTMTVRPHPNFGTQPASQSINPPSIQLDSASPSMLVQQGSSNSLVRSLFHPRPPLQSGALDNHLSRLPPKMAQSDWLRGRSPSVASHLSDMMSPPPDSPYAAAAFRQTDYHPITFSETRPLPLATPLSLTPHCP